MLAGASQRPRGRRVCLLRVADFFFILRLFYFVMATLLYFTFMAALLYFTSGNSFDFFLLLLSIRASVEHDA